MRTMRKHITISTELYNYCCEECKKFNNSFSAFITYCIYAYKEGNIVVKAVQDPFKENEEETHYISEDVMSSIQDILNM